MKFVFAEVPIDGVKTEKQIERTRLRIEKLERNRQAAIAQNDQEWVEVWDKEIQKAKSQLEN